MPHLAALVALSLLATAPALELDDLLVDLRERDKRQHVAAGVIVGAVTYAAVDAFAPEKPEWLKVGAAVLASAVVGVAKELVDRRHPDEHEADPGDATATALGGAIGGFCISVVYRW